MEVVTGVSEELMLAANNHGPGSQVPPNMRLPFPLVALPGVLGGFVRETSDALGVPVECVATPALAACAAAIGNTYRIRLNPSWTEPSVLWAVTLMESGETPAYQAAMAPLVAEQENYDASYQYDQDIYVRAKQLRKADPAEWKAINLGETVAPIEPRAVDLLTSKCAVESLATLLTNNKQGLALTQDGLNGFLTRLGASQGGRGGDEYLEFYKAGTVKLHRSSGKHLFVPMAALSIVGTCQPGAFRKAIGADQINRNLVENPLAARFILASPEPTPPPPQTGRETKPYETGPYHDLIGKLLALRLPLDANSRAEPDIVPLLPESQERFDTFITEHEQQTAAIGNPALRSHYANLVGVAARLALIHYLCDQVTQQLVGPPGVQLRHVLAGIAVARWYGREAQRVYAGHEPQAERETRELLEDIRKKGGVITIGKMKGMRRRWSDPEKAELALRSLARAGHGELTMVEASASGGRPYYRFKLFAQQAVTSTPEFSDSAGVGDTAT